MLNSKINLGNTVNSQLIYSLDSHLNESYTRLRYLSDSLYIRLYNQLHSQLDIQLDTLLESRLYDELRNQSWQQS